MFLISIYHLDFGTSVAMEHNTKIYESLHIKKPLKKPKKKPLKLRCLGGF